MSGVRIVLFVVVFWVCLGLFFQALDINDVNELENPDGTTSVTSFTNTLFKLFTFDVELLPDFWSNALTLIFGFFLFVGIWDMLPFT